LINNAKEALVKDTQNDKKEIIINLEEDEKHIILSIQDNGLGIPKKIQEKVFDAYFSTNSEGKGRGLGLYMSKKIIEEQFKGKLLLHNDGGAVFTILLPL
jgi:signal transduction histidine kinase